MKRVFKIFLPAFLLFIFFSCYQRKKLVGIAFWQSYNLDSIEIKLPYVVKGKGNIHQLNLDEYEFSEADWIYLPKNKKFFESKDLTLTHERGKTIYPWSQSELKGSLMLDDSIITIDFQLPAYNDKGEIEKWEEYKLNGVYTLKRGQ